jgi:DNA topoisomerase-2
LKRFGLTTLTPDILALLKKRVYDMAGIFNSNVKVYLNNKRIKISKFEDYCKLYLPGDANDSIRIYDKNMKTDRWEVMVSFTDGDFK